MPYMPGKAVSVFEALSESSEEEGQGEGLEEGSGRSSLTPMLWFLNAWQFKQRKYWYNLYQPLCSSENFHVNVKMWLK